MINSPGDNQPLEPTRAPRSAPAAGTQSAERSPLLRPTIDIPTSSDSMRQRLDDLGWKQGSVLSPEPELIAAIELVPFSNFQQLPEPPFWCIVVSRDCI